MAFSAILLGLAAIFSGVTVISIVVVIQSRREQHNSIFPIVRENEGIKARRAGISVAVFAILTAISLGAWLATQQNPSNVLIAKEITQQIQTTETTATSETVIQSTSITQEQDDSASVTVQQGEVNPTMFFEVPTDTPKPTNPTVNTVVSSSDLEPTVRVITPIVTPTPVTSPIPAPEGAKIGPIIFTLELNNEREALNPEKVFDLQAERIYATFPYNGMKDGVPFTAIWYYDNKEIFRDEYLWNWGISDRSFVFIKPIGAGNYRIELQIGDDVLASGTFEVVP